WAAILPFLVQHRSETKLAEAKTVSNAVEQLTDLRALAGQIGFATAQWQTIQDEASRTVSTARQVAEQMTSEAKAFAEFMQKAGDAEKNHLRLEVEKLRRIESDWLQVLVMTMDHVYALN